MFAVFSIIVVGGLKNSCQNGFKNSYLNKNGGQIMDPKMDAGMTGSATNTLEEAIEKGFAPINLSVLELIDVMDHLLSCEVENVLLQ